MGRRYKRPKKHHQKRRLPFWKAVNRYGFGNALRYELRNSRRYPKYPIWFIPLIISMIIIAIILYYFPIDYAPVLFYILEIIAVGYMMYRSLKRLDRIRIRNTLQLWGLKILSGIVSIIGILIMYFVLISFLIVPLESLLDQESTVTQIVTFGHQWHTPYVIPLLLEIVGIGLCLIGAYLLFKFKITVGPVIHVGRF